MNTILNIFGVNTEEAPKKNEVAQQKTEVKDVKKEEVKKEEKKDIKVEVKKEEKEVKSEFKEPSIDIRIQKIDLSEPKVENNQLVAAKKVVVNDKPVNAGIIVEKEAILHETIKKDTVEIIQPIVHREIEQPFIHRVVQPVYQKEINEVDVKKKKLEAIHKDTVVVAPSEEFFAKHDRVEESTLEIETTVSIVEKAPIIIEHKKKVIIEEIQPIINREIVQPELIKERLDIYEKVIEAPVYIEEVRKPIYTPVEYAEVKKI